jgi:hypothetical protein
MQLVSMRGAFSLLHGHAWRLFSVVFNEVNVSSLSTS